jgi:YidC/Oxa1 family membrane protein insertase
MDKRAFLAIALSILVLVIYQEWVTRYYGTPPPTPEAKETPEKPPGTEPASSAPARASCGPRSAANQDIRVETDNYCAVYQPGGSSQKLQV